MKIIYVVEGACGEYSDHKEWPVRAFVSEDAAKAFVILCAEGFRLWRVAHPDVYDEIGEMLPTDNPHDPHMRVDCTGTNYYYYPVELGE